MNRAQIERAEEAALLAPYGKAERVRIRREWRRGSAWQKYKPSETPLSRFYEEANKRAEIRRLEYLRFLGLKELLEIERRIVGVNEAGEWSRPESLATREKREKVYDFTDRQLELARKALGLA